MNNKELKSLVALLDDDDAEVVAHVEEKLKTLGTGVIPFLEEAWEQTFNPKAHGRIEDLVHFLQFELVQERLTHWHVHEQEDLLKGMWILATYQYPDLEYAQLSNKIEQLYREIWTQLGPDLLPFDQIKTINSMLFEKYIGMSENSFSRELYMNEEQLKHMLRSGQHVGNHGYNHFWWNSLTKEEMKEELDLSLAFLNKIGVDMNNWTACYPYGSYDSQSIEMLRESGCKLALTTEVNIATINKNTRLFYFQLL